MRKSRRISQLLMVLIGFLGTFLLFFLASAEAKDSPKDPPAKENKGKRQVSIALNSGGLRGG